MLIKISKVIAVSVFFAVPIAAGQEKLDCARILHNGCSINQLYGKVWRAYVWADYQDRTQKHDFPPMVVATQQPVESVEGLCRVVDVDG